MGIALISLCLKEPDNDKHPGLTASWQAGQTDLSENISKDGAQATMDASGQTSTSPELVPEAASPYLILGDKSLSLGESVDSLLDKFGQPGRIAATEYDFAFYVYNNDYSNMVFVAVSNGLVEGFYTDSLKFNFMGIAAGSDLKEVNRVLESSFSPSDIISYETDGYQAQLLFDRLESGLVTGIYVLSKQVKEDGYDDEVMRNVELLNYDLVNSLRVRNGLPALAWSSTAAKAARYHSIDMAKNHYFDHISPNRSLPGDRLLEEGILAQRVGENIIAGYGSAILSNHGWFNSPGHRKNLLNPDYVCLGVGFTYDQGSPYKTYMTQLFYK